MRVSTYEIGEAVNALLPELAGELGAFCVI
jgi:hypothetical protein